MSTEWLEKDSLRFWLILLQFGCSSSQSHWGLLHLLRLFLVHRRLRVGVVARQSWLGSLTCSCGRLAGMSTSSPNVGSVSLASMRVPYQ
jgi:hypothetical protein